MLKKGDIILIICVATVIGIIFFASNYDYKSKDGEKNALVKHDGKIIKSIDLNNIKQPVYVRIKEYNVAITAEKGKIRFIESDCRDKICIKSGWLSHKGERAVCIPSKTEIMIIEKEEIDSLSY